MLKERPILFSAPMARAILDGKKTQTRRIVNHDRFRVRLRHTVESDLSEYFPKSDRLCAKPGVYPARIYEHGAVAALLGDKGLGVKPREFDFECPYADGETILESGGGWRIVPAVGQRLWVRETWGYRGSMWESGKRAQRRQHFLEYRADGTKRHVDREVDDDHAVPKQVCRCKSSGDANEDYEQHRDELTRYWRMWRPAIFMPRDFSRITLEVTDVRVERLQSISEDDARAEGIAEPAAAHGAWCDPAKGREGHWSYRKPFADLWDSINGKRAPWASNPWVWCVSFRRIAPAAAGETKGGGG